MSARPRLFLFAVAFAAFTLLGCASAGRAQPALEHAGETQCWYPDQEAHRCAVMARYERLPDGREVAWVDLLAGAEPLIVMRAAWEVHANNGARCLSTTDEGLAAATFTASDHALTDEELTALRSAVQHNFRNREMCWADVTAAPFAWLPQGADWRLMTALTPAVRAGLTRAADVFQDARDGFVQCASPDLDARRCIAISRFEFRGVEVIEHRRTAMNREPRVVMSLAGPAYSQSTMICSTWRPDDLVSATFEVNGVEANAAQAEQIRAQLRERLFGGSCLPAPPPTTGDLGLGMSGVLSASGSIWVRPEDNFAVGYE
ncbi:MAG: hypothetical protein ABL889_21655 [Terricaulis sp.]